MEIVNGCSDMHDTPILSQLKEFKAIFLWKIFPYHWNFSPKLIKVPVLLFDTLEYIEIQGHFCDPQICEHHKLRNYSNV